jgi:hypothetical protein
MSQPEKIDPILDEVADIIKGTRYTITGYSWNFTRDRFDIVISPGKEDPCPRERKGP